MNPSRLRAFRGGLPLVGALILGVGMIHGVPDPPPRWMQQVTLSKPGPFKAVPACELHYDLSWNGLLKAGEATLNLGLKAPNTPSHLVGICQGKSTGLARRLWTYQNNFRSQVASDSLQPVFFESREREKKERIHTQARFAEGVVTSTETVTKLREGARPKTKERVFAYEHAHDLLSAVLYLRSQPLKNGDEINLVVHPFKSAYFAKFRVLGRETFKSPLGPTKAIKLNIQLYKIDRDDLELKSYSKFKKATIWLSEDAYRMPLEVRSEVFIGSVRATLQRRKFLEKGS